MLWSGVIFLSFLLFLLAVFPRGSASVAPETWERGHVYSNFVATFSRPAVAFFYILAMVLLGIHLFHGIWSMFQSMGINHPRFNRTRRYLVGTLSVMISAGFIAPVLAVVFGLL